MPHTCVGFLGGSDSKDACNAGGECNSVTLPESTHVSIYMYCTLFPLNKYFTYFTTVRLCGNSFLYSQRARALATDHWSNG